ncbi:MAG: hypothetical protein D6776_02540 [Planctomycetota bacterium]|nr:MAG: hypothetical protein D6776_02540 [Planctomycetota bacterium]
MSRRRYVVLGLALAGVLLASASATTAAEGEASAATPAQGSGVPDRIGWDRLWLRGRSRALEGRIVRETATGYRFRMRGASSDVVVPKDEIERVERAPTPREVYARRRAAIAPGDAQAHLALARTCLGWGLEAEAETELRAAIAIEPTLLEAVGELAALLERRCARAESEPQRAGCEEALLEVYEDAQAHGLVSVPLALGHARLLRRLGAPTLALERLSSLALADNDTATARIRLERARLALEVGAYGRAEQDLRPLVEGGSDPALLAESWRTLGLVHLAQGRHGEAQRAFAEAAERAPEDRWAALFSVRAALYAGALEAAADGWAGLPEGQEPEYAATRAIVGALLATALGELDTARQRLAGAPTDTAPVAGTAALRRARLELARAYVRAAGGEVVSATAELDRLAAAQPELAGVAQAVRAATLAAAGQLEAARAAIEAAARAGLDFDLVAAERMRLEFRLGNDEQALRYARYLAHLRRDDPPTLVEIGRMLTLMAGRSADAPRARRLRAEARERFEDALARRPGYELATLGLAYLDYVEARYEAAERRLRALVQAGSRSAYARAALERIERARSRRVWRDRFDRPDAEAVRGRWSEDEAYGVQAQIAGRRLVFRGRQQRADGGRTRVLRRIGRRRLAEFRVRFERAQPSALRYGIEVALESGEAVAFGHEADGSLAVSWRGRGGKAWSEPETLGPLEGTGPHTLAIEIDRTDKTVVLRLDGRELARVRKTAFVRGGETTCSIWVAAERDTEVELVVREAAIFVVRDRTP